MLTSNAAKYDLNTLKIWFYTFEASDTSLGRYFQQVFQICFNLEYFPGQLNPGGIAL